MQNGGLACVCIHGYLETLSAVGCVATHARLPALGAPNQFLFGKTGAFNKSINNSFQHFVRPKRPQRKKQEKGRRN